VAIWVAEHDGYLRLDPPVRHRRSVLLDRASRAVDIVDQIDGGSHDIRLAFHFGPEVQAELQEFSAFLSWPSVVPSRAARLELPPGLRWRLHRGETDPILGWYAHGLGQRVSAFTLVGCGRCLPGAPLATRLEFREAAISPRAAISLRDISLCTSDASLTSAPETRAEGT